MKRVLFLAALFLGVIASGASPVTAQMEFGAEAMFGSETDAGLGARLQLPLGTEIPLDFQGGFNLFFPDGPAEYWEINGNLWYTIPTSGSTNVEPYAGGGINLGHASVSGFSNTDIGLNLGGGARFIFENTTPFVEARFVIGGAEQFVIGAGVLFGG